MKIRKRNGSEVNFNKQNIINAITLANDKESIENRLTVQQIKDIAKNVEEKCKKSNVYINVEDIQNFVQNEIFSYGKESLFEHYVTYRYTKDLDRNKNTTDDAILSLLCGDNETIQQENANKNPNIVSTMRDYMAGEVSKDLSKRYLIPQDIYKAHKEGIIHFHDMDYFAMPEYNCCLVNLDDMLQNGTIISGVTIDKPHTFGTACNIASQIAAQVASSQYGGQTMSASHLSKFVKSSREYFRKQELEKNPNISEEQLKINVEYDTLKDIEKGVQTLQYQITTLMTTNGQTPFISINLYLNEAETEEDKEDLAIVIKEILKQRIVGIKNQNGQYYANPFPKLLYVLEEDNINEESKYWYLTKLAAECTTKRMVPDYISEKVMKDLKRDKKGNGYCYPCMGCVSGDSKIKIRVNNEIKIITIEEMWNTYAKNVKHQYSEDNPNLYSELENVEIFDNRNGFTKCSMINKNVNNNWVLIKLKGSNEVCEIICTDNHIWTTTEGIDKTTIELSLNDKLWYSINENETIEMNIDTIININDNKPSFDVTTNTKHFEVNGLYSHNCRSFLTPFMSQKHKETIICSGDEEFEVV